MKIFRKHKKAIIFLGVILTIGLILRIYRLTYIPVFADEAIYIRWAQIMAAEPTLRFLPLSDGKQPLFMWVLMFTVKRFSDPLFVGRFLSVCSGLGTIVGIYFLAFLLFKSKRIALVSSLIWTISPFSLFFDRMALVDSMLAMFGLWSLVLGIVTAKTKRLDAAMITGFSLGFALLTKSPAIFFVILLPTTWLLSKPLQLGKQAVLLGVTYVIAFAMYSILRLGPNFQLIGLRNQDYVFPFTHVLANFGDPFIFHIKEMFMDWMWRLAPGILMLLFVIGIIGNFKKYWREMAILGAWFFVPLLVQSEFAKVFTARYVLFILPAFFVIVASSFLVKKEILKKLAVGGFVIFIIQSMATNYLLFTNIEAAPLPSSERSGYLEEWTSGTGIKEVSEYLKAKHNDKPAQQIVVGTEGYFGTLPDGLQMYMEGTPKVTVIGVGLDIKEVPPQLRDSKKAGNPTYLVVNSSRLNIKGNLEDAGFKLIAVYPKAIRQEQQSREFVMYGPQESLYLLEVMKL
jgi:4-amino-4-deoxy-L-arabinose transferase-like glycosyltransferase